MKRLFAMLLALAMLLSLSVTAFAAEDTGSITISNATPEKVYTVYKIFDATYSETNDGKTAVAYKIDPETNPELFAALAFDKNNENAYFIYNPETHAVTKKEKVNDSDLIEFLTGIVEDAGINPDRTGQVADGAEKAEVKFEGLPLGYYMVFSTLGTTVTITSNTPDAVVIDKNQMPFTKGFSKDVKKPTETAYSDGVSVNIGDLMNYKVDFISSNYFEDQKIKYYQIHDEIGEAIWIDFDSIVVQVGDKTLTKGYYLNGTGEENNYVWENLKVWNKDVTDAEWYLVHLSETQFRITIPWLHGHKLIDNDNGTFNLQTNLENDSLYNTGDHVTITYNAALKSDAVIGGGEYVAMKNTAYASAICQDETKHSTPDYALTEVYGLGILKDDLATKKNLAGAKFRLYSNEACTQPVYVIPTDCDGVYIVDSLNKTSNGIIGIHELPRQLFDDSSLGVENSRLLKYLNGKPQDNYVVSQKNGKLVVLGLAEGTYYLQEVEAPKGYNSLTEPVPLTLSTDSANAFSIFANGQGQVEDTQLDIGDYVERTFNVTHTTVHNSQGVELPSTGGEGTILLITIGTIVAMAFAVLMITQKKMSIYKD